MTYRNSFVALGFAAMLAFAAPAVHAQALGGRGETVTVSSQAKVTAIDPQTREITLHTVSGEELKVVAGPAVQELRPDPCRRRCRRAVYATARSGPVRSEHGAAAEHHHHRRREGRARCEARRRGRATPRADRHRRRHRHGDAPTQPRRSDRGRRPCPDHSRSRAAAGDGAREGRQFDHRDLFGRRRGQRAAGRKEELRRISSRRPDRRSANPGSARAARRRRAQPRR